MTRALPVTDPRTGRLDFELTVADRGVVADVAGRLRKAQAAWGDLPVEARCEVLARWAKQIGGPFRQAIIDADSRDTGYGQISKIAPDMMLGILRGNIATAAQQLAGAHREGTARSNPNIRYTTVLKPYPVVGVISPWNAPTMLCMLHAIPPLFAGCAVLVKPSEVTPRYVEPLRASLAEVPELASVLDFVLGDGETGQALVESCDYIAFVGSVPNGRKVAEACARRLIPCDMELGGKDPLVILASAHLEDAVSATLRGAVTSTGQVCFSIERIYVQASIHDHFVARLTERAKLIRLNHPDPHSGHIGPFIAARQAAVVDAHIDDALAKGAKIVLGGKSFLLDGGHYMRPTILVDVTHEMKIMREETFGPVMPIMRFSTVDEAVELANDTEYGLSAAVMGGTEEEALAVARRIDAGNVSVQDAFLTFYAAPAESDSFRSSGVAGGRQDLSRYVRRQALLVNRGKPACMVDEALNAAG